MGVAFSLTKEESDGVQDTVMNQAVEFSSQSANSQYNATFTDDIVQGVSVFFSFTGPRGEEHCDRH